MGRNLKTEVGGEVHFFDENDLRNTASSNAPNFTILRVITESQRQFLVAITCGHELKISKTRYIKMRMVL